MCRNDCYERLITRHVSCKQDRHVTIDYRSAQETKQTEGPSSLSDQLHLWYLENLSKYIGCHCWLPDGNASDLAVSWSLSHWSGTCKQVESIYTTGHQYNVYPLVCNCRGIVTTHRINYKKKTFHWTLCTTVLDMLWYMLLCVKMQTCFVYRQYTKGHPGTLIEVSAVWVTKVDTV